MTLRTCIIVFLTIFGFAATRVYADSTQVADTVCKWFDSTGVTSAPCKVSEQSRTMDVRLNVDRYGAIKVCLEIKMYCTTAA